MSKDGKRSVSRWRARVTEWVRGLRASEEQVFFALTLALGAVVGLAVVAFIVARRTWLSACTLRTARWWRRVLTPVVGSLIAEYLLYRYAPDARGSGVPRPTASCLLSCD